MASNSSESKYMKSVTKTLRHQRHRLQKQLEVYEKEQEKKLEEITNTQNVLARSLSEESANSSLEAKESVFPKRKSSLSTASGFSVNMRKISTSSSERKRSTYGETSFRQLSDPTQLNGKQLSSTTRRSLSTEEKSLPFVQAYPTRKQFIKSSLFVETSNSFDSKNGKLQSSEQRIDRQICLDVREFVNKKDSLLEYKIAISNQRDKFYKTGKTNSESSLSELNEKMRGFSKQRRTEKAESETSGRHIAGINNVYADEKAQTKENEKKIRRFSLQARNLSKNDGFVEESMGNLDKNEVIKSVSDITRTVLEKPRLKSINKKTVRSLSTCVLGANLNNEDTIQTQRKRSQTIDEIVSQAGRKSFSDDSTIDSKSQTTESDLLLNNYGNAWIDINTKRGSQVYLPALTSSCGMGNICKDASESGVNIDAAESCTTESDIQRNRNDFLMPASVSEVRKPNSKGWKILREMDLARLRNVNNPSPTPSSPNNQNSHIHTKLTSFRSVVLAAVSQNKLKEKEKEVKIKQISKERLSEISKPTESYIRQIMASEHAPRRKPQDSSSPRPLELRSVVRGLQGIRGLSQVVNANKMLRDHQNSRKKPVGREGMGRTTDALKNGKSLAEMMDDARKCRYLRHKDSDLL
ncbi:predicted protein [Nematostella vectensis]|uniref:Uncharacterized protein n=1 Tax=Nematostella vectensis TaxID=45351 RepID=A7T1E1_NEMVE|nr:predicted protein [Nematostella vectensis]|eukprot:XP_001622319.1 hypothetical protein NEMVEDRAFT_v1g248496 [Nematostella vectensis]